MKYIKERIFAWIVLMLGFLAISSGVIAQNVVRKGQTFYAVNDSVKGDTKTEYFYVDSKGKKYSIYISRRGKAYIKCISQKTGKEYKRYLPKVTEQLKK